MQINTLIYTMGNEVENVLYSYQLSEDDLKKYHMKKFESHFVKRRMQHLKGRNSKETGVRWASRYFHWLYCLAEHCGYGTLRDELIRDRIVVGLQSAAHQKNFKWTLSWPCNRSDHSSEHQKRQTTTTSAAGHSPIRTGSIIVSKWRAKQKCRFS